MRLPFTDEKNTRRRNNRNGFILLLLLALPGLQGAHAQQTLFNLPSLVATERHRAFMQEQVNVTTREAAFNFSSSYGLGKGFEVGLNVFGVNMNYAKGTPVLLTNRGEDRNAPYSPLLLVTALKVFEVNEYVRVGVGTQVGGNPFEGARLDFADFSYLSTVTRIPGTHLDLHGGAYYGSRGDIGRRNEVGWMAGYEWELDRHWHLMGDWIYGKNAVAVLVPGVVYLPHRKVALSLGYQLPSPGSGNPRAVVFELTLL
jgi:hypothetical protein